VLDCFLFRGGKFFFAFHGGASTFAMRHVLLNLALEILCLDVLRLFFLFCVPYTWRILDRHR